MNNVLRASGLKAGYGRIEVLHGIDLAVNEGEIVAILGPNGAGKTTTLLALSGAIPSRGRIEFLGAPIHPEVRTNVKQGLAFLPDQRGVIRALTVEQNLTLAAVDPAEAFRISPELETLRFRKGGDLSGGEQQILALTRTIASRPKFIMADEMSFGLGPIVVARMFGLLQRVAEAGTAVLLVEQFARQALKISHRAYVLERGTIAFEGMAHEVLVDVERLEQSYLANARDPAVQ